MIFIGGAALLGLAIALVLTRIAPDLARGANTMMLICALLLAAVLGYRGYLFTLIPRDLEQVFAVVPDIRRQHSTPDEPGTDALERFLDFSFSDPVAAEVAARIRTDLRGIDAPDVWLVEVRFEPDEVLFWHRANDPRHWARNAWTPQQLMYRSGADQAFVVVQPSDMGTLVLYAVYGTE